MSDEAIFFEFDEERSAYLAMDTLQELGYQPGLVEGAHKPTLHVHVDKQDLTSALEIAQAHGGRLTEGDEALSETGLYQLAYDIDAGIRIPAHIVNEDFGDNYTQADMPEAEHRGTSAIDTANVIADDSGASPDSYDGFSAGIRL